MVKTKANAGFTLLEVLAVLAIVTLVMGVALPRIGFQASPATTEAFAMRVIAALETESYAARRHGAASTSEIDTRKNLIRLASSKTPFVVPHTIALGTRSAPACDPTGQKIIFYADGTSCAPILTLTSATSMRMIAINPLTGAISLAP